MTENTLREEICAIAKSMFDRGLTRGSSGNISVRLADGNFLLTPTNSCLGRIDPARISKIDGGGKLLAGDSPSKESFLRLAMYQERPESTAVVHLHSLHAVAVSCLANHGPVAAGTPLSAAGYAIEELEQRHN